MAGLKIAAFREPDLNHELTAIALAPSPRVRKFCGGFPLCLKEYPTQATFKYNWTSDYSPISNHLISLNNMNKYHRLRQALESEGVGKMKCFGQSMLPILKSGSLLTFRKQSEYKVGDIVFCKVRGRFIDAHKVVKTHPHRGYLIANNHGHENGWTRTIFGKAVSAEFNHQIKELE